MRAVRLYTNHQLSAYLRLSHLSSLASGIHIRGLPYVSGMQLVNALQSNPGGRRLRGVFGEEAVNKLVLQLIVYGHQVTTDACRLTVSSGFCPRDSIMIKQINMFILTEDVGVTVAIYRNAHRRQLSIEEHNDQSKNVQQGHHNVTSSHWLCTVTALNSDMYSCC